jgi:hypothetical protein
MAKRNSRVGTESHKLGYILRDNIHIKNKNAKILQAIKKIALNINTDIIKHVKITLPSSQSQTTDAYPKPHKSSPQHL